VVTEILRALKESVEAFEVEAHEILAKHESSRSRVISVEETRKRLTELSLQQDELFQQAIECVERGIYRAAHVMAWAAFIDYLEDKLASDGLVKVKAIKSGWTKYQTIEELRESIPEFQIIEAARDVSLLSKNEMKSIQGLLSKRNECAHPTGYSPDLNESLGFIAELLKRIEKLHGKTL
jgi:hypothetical protein